MLFKIDENCTVGHKQRDEGLGTVLLPYDGDSEDDLSDD